METIRTIIKENGVTQTYNKIKHNTNEPYINNEDNCFTKPIDFSKIGNMPIEEQKIIIKSIKLVVKEVTEKDKKGFMKTQMNSLKVSQTKKDLLNIIENIINEYQSIINQYIILMPEYKIKIRKMHINNIKNTLTKNDNLVLATFVKSIIKEYYMKFLLSISDEELEKLYKSQPTEKFIEETLKKYKDKFNKNNKNGVYELTKRTISDLLDTIYAQRQKHLCFECQNGIASKCPKINDRIKKPIDKYDFIQNGYQTIDEEDQINNFIVTNCKFYQETPARDESIERKEYLKKVKENIKVLFFDAENYEEANLIEYDSYIKGQLKNDHYIKSRAHLYALRIKKKQKNRK